MPRNQNNNNRNKRRSRKRVTFNTSRSITPVIVSQPVFREIFRFRATSALTSTIFVRCITNLLHVATAANVSYPIISSFKILRVAAYTFAEGGSGTEVNTVAVTFLGGQFGKNVEFTATGSAAQPGVVNQLTPANSSASFWRSQPQSGAISGNGEPLLFINSQTTGVILDIDLLFSLTDGAGNPPGAALTTALATVGYLYTNDLDNSTSSGAVGNQNLIPVGRGPLAANG